MCGPNFVRMRLEMFQCDVVRVQAASSLRRTGSLVSFGFMDECGAYAAWLSVYNIIKLFIYAKQRTMDIFSSYTHLKDELNLIAKVIASAQCIILENTIFPHRNKHRIYFIK